MITIRIEGTAACQGTTMVGQHIQLLLAQEGYEVVFVSAEHSPKHLADRLAFLEGSKHLRSSLSRIPVRIMDHHTAPAKVEESTLTLRPSIPHE